MARVKKNAIHGAAGQLVYRTVNGKVIASAKPSKYKKSKSRALLSNRKKFSYAGSLAKEIKEEPILFAAWEQYSKGESNSHNSIMSNNIQLSTDAGLTVSNIIVPPSKYNLIKDISLIDNSINLSIELFENYHAIVLDKQLRVCLLFTGLNSTYETQYKTLEEIIISKEEDNISAISINLNSALLDFIGQYENVILYAAAIWTFISPHKLCWSSSFAKKI